MLQPVTPFCRLTNLLESLRQNTGDGFGMLDRAPVGPTSMMQSGISQAREIDDPPGLHEKTEYLLREWVNMYHSPAGGRDSTKAFSAFVQQVGEVITSLFIRTVARVLNLCIACTVNKHGGKNEVMSKHCRDIQV